MPAKRRTTSKIAAFDVLEPRIALTVLSPSFIGPLSAMETRALIADVSYPPKGVAPDVDAALSISPTTIGNVASCTLTITNQGLSFPISTSWTYTIAYGGLTTPSTTLSTGQLTTASLGAPVPGTYTVTAVTTYGGYPGATSPPTTATASITVAPPSVVAKQGGINTPVNWQTMIQVTDTVSSSAGQVGGITGGMIQEQIAQFNFYNGTTTPGPPGWFPNAPGSGFYLANGVLYDTVGTYGMTQQFWDAIPVGTSFMTWTQQLQYVWTMSGFVNGNPANQTFTVPLTTLQWSAVKNAATTWVAK